jgi:hypothetical protein
MTVAANGSFEKRVVFPRGRVVYFKARYIGFAAVEALRIVAPQFRSTPFEPPCTRDGPRILHTLASGIT